MKSWRVAVVAFAIATPLAVTTVVAGCDQGSPASPSSPPLASADPLCPTPLDPTFDSIRLHLLGTDTCGSGRSACHSATGAGGLSYQLGATDLYFALVGDAGTGHIGIDQNGATGHPPEYRVIPGDSDASMLYVKLNIPDGGLDPDFGSGMPLDHPGALCPQDIVAVKTWIDNGALFEEDGATPFPIADASEDADASDASPDAADLDAGDAGD